jgi:hypothetical protein
MRPDPVSGLYLFYPKRLLTQSREAAKSARFLEAFATVFRYHLSVGAGDWHFDSTTEVFPLRPGFFAPLR